MKLRSIIIFFVFLSVTCSMFSSSMSVLADTAGVPNQSYTYWNDINSSSKKPVNNKNMYKLRKVFGAKDIGIDEFSEIIDVFTDESGYIYMLDKDSRIIILNSAFEVIREIKSVIGIENNKFVGAVNIFVGCDKTIYICDPENKRVLHISEQGNYIDEFVVPESSVIPEDFNFKPIRVAVDSKKYVYILCEGSYYGALLYSPDNKCIGFYGANAVTNGVVDAFRSLIGRVMPNNAKKANDSRKLPFVFSDIVVDSEDFVYTATDSALTSQIKELGPGIGNNILPSDGVNFIDSDVNRTYNNGGALVQRITGLDVNNKGFIFCLDSTYGRVFVYDSECRMLTAFGGGIGSGTQKGTFVTASAISVNNKSEVFICDNSTNLITVFSPNKYGYTVLDLTEKTIKGEYEAVKDGWEEVLLQDKNLQIAYIGLARAYIVNKNYDMAISTAKNGCDRDTYALAFEYARQEWFSKHFSALFMVFILIVAAIITFAEIVYKKNICLVPNRKAYLMFNVMVHPEKSFQEIKEKHRGSVIIALILIFIFYLSSVSQMIFGGFLFTVSSISSYNSILVLARTIGVILLWVVSNWLVCTLFGGIGRIKDIFIVTCYSLTPVIIGKIIWTIVSNFILPSESAILTVINSVSIVIFLIIFVVGMLTIHDFTFIKLVSTCFLTALMMSAIVFILILSGILLQQFFGFVSTIFVELLI